MKKIYIPLLCLFLSVNIFAQTNPAELSNSSSLTPDMFPKTPEANGLSKFVDIPSGNYTGVATFTIPIYDIDLNGTKIPIQLNYSTKGVTVGEIATRTGLGWSLDTGASLSQQVIGTPDFIRNGTRPIINRSTFDPIHNENDKQLAREVLDIMQGSGKPQDLQPDIFSYNILGSGGHFIVRANGIDGIPMPLNQDKIIRSSRGVDIYNDKGILHGFVTDESVQSYNSCNTNIGFEYNDPNYKISQIKTPTGQKVDYNYEEYINSTYTTSVSHSRTISSLENGPLPKGFGQAPDICYNYSINKESILTKIDFPNGYIEFNYVNKLNSDSERKDLPGDKILKTIVVKNNSGSILRNYELNYKYIKSSETFSSDRNYLKGVDYRLFLTSVEEKNTGGLYELDYYEGIKNPTRISNDQDYWGIYNGKNNTISIPTVRSIVGLEGFVLGFSGANKQADIDYGVIGNLKRVTYPTKGFTEIKYENDEFLKDFTLPDDYEIIDYPGYVSTDSNLSYDFDITQYFDKKISGTFKVIGRQNEPSAHGGCKIQIKNLGNNSIIFESDKYGNWSTDINDGRYRISILPATMYNYDCETEFTTIEKIPKETSDTGIVGTLRIKSLKSKDGKGNVITREFTYKNPITGKTSGKNFGEGYFDPIVYDEIGFKPDEITLYTSYLQKISVTNNPGWQTSTVRGKSIGYEYVQEIYKGDGISFKKQYKFDNDHYNNYGYRPRNVIQLFWPMDGFQRGQLKEVIDFNASGDWVRKEIYEHDYSTQLNKGWLGNNNGGETIDVGIVLKYGAKPDQRPFIFDTFSVKNYWIRPTKKTTIEKLNGQEIVKEETYEYNSSPKHTYPWKVSLLNSRNEKIVQETTYPLDHPAEVNMSDLIDMNIHSAPITKKTTNLTKNIKVEETKSTYGKFTTKNLVLPQFVYVNKGNNPINTTNITTDKEISFDAYDTYGNLTQYTIKDVTTSVIWGYKGTYPVAKIEGEKLSNLSSATIKEIEDVADNAILTTKLKNLISSTSSAMVTGYIYEPLKGVTQMINPNGTSIYYNYDAYGRLLNAMKEDDNGTKTVIKSNEYNYKN